MTDTIVSFITNGGWVLGMPVFCFFLYALILSVRFQSNQIFRSGLLLSGIGCLLICWWSIAPDFIHPQPITEAIFTIPVFILLFLLSAVLGLVLGLGVVRVVSKLHP